jgi:solute:Na+ symporter, SSS family
LVFLMALGLAVGVSLAKPKTLSLAWKLACGLALLAIALSPGLEVMHRLGLALLLAVTVWLLMRFGKQAHINYDAANANRIDTGNVSYATTSGFNMASAGVIAILIALYAVWW